MGLILSVVQILLALHTFIGAVWKLSNSEQTIPSLKAMPHRAWLGLSVFEVLCGIGLLVPLFVRSVAMLAPIGAAGIAAEMVLLSALHIRSGEKKFGPVIYWLGAALICAAVGYGRFVTAPA